MSERPILFSGPMVRAILEGRKSQTRRIAKLTASGNVKEPRGHRRWHPGDPEVVAACPYGRAGDRLWVREAWAQRLDRDHLNGTQLYAAGVREAWYWADGPGRCCRTGCAGAAGRVRTARFMPRWASRITLEVTGVRVERLQDISEADALAEGVEITVRENGALEPFRSLWKSINGHESWSANPLVWCVSFRRLKP